MIAHYTVGREYLGSTDLPAGATSVAFLCDQCGPTAWASIVIAGASWSFEYARCEKHPREGRTPGSLLRPWYCELAYLSPANAGLALECLPPPALKRELNLLLKEEPDDSTIRP